MAEECKREIVTVELPMVPPPPPPVLELHENVFVPEIYSDSDAAWEKYKLDYAKEYAEGEEQMR